jgi:peptidoglycan/LPS O-acetylase OafA/YrhL
LYDAKNDAGYFRNFYIRRFLRIFPLYYGFLIVFFWLLPRIHPFTPAMDRMAAQQGWLWGYGANLLMARNGHWAFEVGWMELGHFWTLAIEEQFYLLWPLVVLAIPRKPLMRVCIGCMLAALLLRTILVMHHARPITVGMLTFCRFDALTVGALAALLIRGRPWNLFRPVRVATILVGVAIALLTIMRGNWDAEDPFVQTLGFSLLDLFCAGMLILVLEPRRDNKLRQYFASPALMWFGTYSYAMYVFHVALRPLFKRVVPVESLSMSLDSAYLAVAAYVVFSMSVTAAVAYASWHLYEKHFLKLKKRFAPGRVMRAGAPSTEGPVGDHLSVGPAQPGHPAPI